MNFIYGVGLILLAIAMLWLGRAPKGQDTASFLRVWIFGQIYALAIMIFVVMGIALLFNAAST
jgi:hypothetical protein